MKTLSIDGQTLKKMIIAGANNLSRFKNEIDALNVFPVPDGDTGTNMSFTVLAAANEVAKKETTNIYEVAKTASGGALRGARGNSGVILSQLFRGFAKGLEGKQTATVEELAEALQKGTEMAYKAVMKPKEGTILTIAKSIGENAYDLAFDHDDIEYVLLEIIKRGYDMLSKTTGMLAELKHAGVVDAGGKGLLLVFEGAYYGLTGQAEIILPQVQKKPAVVPSTPIVAATDIEFGYCTEFFIAQDNKDASENDENIENDLKIYLETIGDSIVVVADDDLIKVHVHTDHPGTILEKALELGSLSNLKIENMRLQHTNLIDFKNNSGAIVDVSLESPTPKKDIGIVAVSIGDGFNELFTNLGADALIEGGQSLNPSTEDILTAINKVNAHNVIVLPNNKNVILAAEQAKEINGRGVHVLPTRSIPQGLTALINLNLDLNIDENLDVMGQMIKNVHTGQVTRAVRSTVVDGNEIKEGDYLGIYNGDIVLNCDDVQNAAKKLIDKMIENDGDLLSVYYGEDVSKDMAEELLAYSKDQFDISEVELYRGQQPLYHYIISIE